MDVNHLKFLPIEEDQLNNSTTNIQQSSLISLPMDATYNLDIRDLLNANPKSTLPDDLKETVEKGNLADITLIGSLIKLLRSRGSAHFNDIVNEISKFYHNLRRVDGSKYEGDISKAVKGSLTSSKIFYNTGADIWAIQDQQAQIYERNTTQKLKALLTKQRTKAGRKPKEVSSLEEANKNKGPDLVENELTKTRKKTKRSTEKYQQMYDMLSTTSKALKANDGTAHLIQNPFKGLKGNENLPELWQKIGSERFIGIIECFEYFSPLIEDHLKKQNSDPVRTENQEDKSIVGLEKIKADLSNLYKSLLTFEKVLPKDLK